MVIWELKEVGDLFPFYAKQGDALKALRDYRKEVGDKKEGSGPEKLVVRVREDLIELLMRVVKQPEADEEDPSSEFL